MSLRVSLICDACGTTTEAATCLDTAARGAVLRSGVARGWRRVVVTRDRRQDFCPACAKKLKPFRTDSAAAHQLTNIRRS
jgi:hypothetical protein